MCHVSRHRTTPDSNDHTVSSFMKWKIFNHTLYFAGTELRDFSGRNIGSRFTGTKCPRNHY